MRRGSKAGGPIGRRDDPPYWEHALLTRAEATALAIRARGGDRAARDELILKNQKLVVKIAAFYVDRRFPLGDLVSAGNRGLIRGIDQFDPHRNVSLSTYLWPNISREIQHYIAGHGYTVRISEPTIALVERYRRVERRIARESQRPPRFEDVCGAMDLRGRQERNLRRALDILGADFWDVGTVEGDAFAAESRDLGDRDDRDAADYLLEKLPPKQAGLLRAFYGVGTPREMTYREIAAEQGHTWQAVQQAHKVALRAARRLSLGELQKISHG